MARIIFCPKQSDNEKFGIKPGDPLVIFAAKLGNVSLLETILDINVQAVEENDSQPIALSWAAGMDILTPSECLLTILWLQSDVASKTNHTPGIPHPYILQLQINNLMLQSI